MWGNTVEASRGRSLYNPCETPYGPMETFKYMWVNIISTRECSTKWDAIMAGRDELCENSNPFNCKA